MSDITDGGVYQLTGQSKPLPEIKVCPVNESDSSEVWVIASRGVKWFKLKVNANSLTYNSKDFAAYAESLIKDYGFEAVELRQTNIQTLWREG